TWLGISLPVVAIGATRGVSLVKWALEGAGGGKLPHAASIAHTVELRTKEGCRFRRKRILCWWGYSSSG
ncbi:MAG TPA: hypothetical protein VJ001_18045, partial [Rhodocyclaceae bacterium]|nr:hypothetical protein [Rhodocyclaceae bacterium]